VKVLITGISGAMGKKAAAGLLDHNHTVIGVDRRPWPDAPAGVTMFRTDVRKRPLEEVFRKHAPEALIHMATVTHFTAHSQERYRINLGGTRRIFDYCNRYGVKHALFIGRHTVYGAAADAALYRTEGDPPLAASTFPRLADLVAADLYAGSALWRYPKLRTVVLRLVYTLGPSRRGTLANYVRGPRVPTILGFDPLFQVMHESDAVAAIISALEHPELRGVFNVAGPAPVPLSLLCHIAGRQRVPLTRNLFKRVTGRFGFTGLPEDAIEHVKYPIVIDDSAFREATGFAHSFDEVQTIESFRWV